MRYRFTIPGEPVPYQRMTQGEVRMCQIPDHKLAPAQAKKKARIIRSWDYKTEADLRSRCLPFDRRPKAKVFLNTIIYFPNPRKHPDPENVRKLIQDAIYGQDMKVAGGCDFFYDAERPRVEVEIYEPEEGNV